MVEVNPNLTIVDYDDPTTWRNSPAPIDVSHIQAELTKIGGLIPQGYGEISGKPMFIIVWGQTYKTWLNGKMRLMFDDENIDAKHSFNHFAVPNEVYQRAVSWYLKEEEKRQESLMRCDWVNAQKFTDFTEYLENNESSLNYIRLPKDSNPEIVASLIPPNYQYLCGLRNYEEIGQQCFIILQWQSPEELGNEKDWNNMRYDWVYLPETDTDDNFIDVLGEFPRHGQYSRPVLRIIDKIDDKKFRYREPTMDNVILPMKQLLQLRERLSKYQKSPEYQQQLRIDKFRADQKAQKVSTDFNYRFNDAKPVGKGNPTNVPTVKLKDGINKQGKGKRIL